MSVRTVCKIRWKRMSQASQLHAAYGHTGKKQQSCHVFGSLGSETESSLRI
jgi:hypothetical protein